MKVGIYLKHLDYSEKEVNSLNELTSLEVGGVIYSISHDFNYVARNRTYSRDRADNVASSTQAKDLEESFIKAIKNIQNKIYFNLNLIIKEHSFPRDMTPETDWGGQPIHKEPFILSQTLDFTYQNLDILHQEIAMLNQLSFVSQATKDEVNKIKNETYTFISGFIPMFKVIHPNEEFAHNEATSIEKGKEYLKKILDKNITFNFSGIHSLFNRIFFYNHEDVSRGLKAEATDAYQITNEELQTLENLIHFNEFRAYELSPTILGIMIHSMYNEINSYYSSCEYIKRFKSFDKHLQAEKNSILTHKSIYESDKDRLNKIKLLEENIEEEKIKFAKKHKFHQMKVDNFSYQLNQWIEKFNSSFSTATNKLKTIFFQNIKESKVLSCQGQHIIAVPEFNEDNMVDRYQGVLLNDEEFAVAVEANKPLNQFLLEDWDILGNNEKNIRYTSFHNLNHIIQELNDKKIQEYFFKEPLENIVFQMA